jgi:hypothetical protein
MGVSLGRWNSGIAGLNPAQGMDVCPRLSVLWCPLQVEALRRAHHSKQSYQISKQPKQLPICEAAKVHQGL